MKQMTIKQFCRENNLDSAVVLNVCNIIGIDRDKDELWIFDQNNQKKIKDYIDGRDKKIMIRRPKGIYALKCQCGLVNEYESVEIARLARMWIICDCGQKIEVTSKMTKII